MAAKHTPGPWKAKPDYYGNYILSHPNNRWHFADLDPEGKEAMANAELISRAPEMHKAILDIAKLTNENKRNIKTIDSVAKIVSSAGFEIKDT